MTVKAAAMFAMHYSNKPLAPTHDTKRNSPTRLGVTNTEDCLDSDKGVIPGSRNPSSSQAIHSTKFDNVSDEKLGIDHDLRRRLNHSTSDLGSVFSNSSARSLSDTSSAHSRGLSRSSSNSSAAMVHGTLQTERPDSMFFGKGLFSRSRKSSRDNITRTSVMLRPLASRNDEHVFAPERLFSLTAKRTIRQSPAHKGQTGTSVCIQKPVISGPFNFQHVTHTRQEQLQPLHHSRRDGLASEFAAIQATQGPIDGKLNGIAADDIHRIETSIERANHVRGEVATEARPRTGLRTRTHTLANAVHSARPRKLSKTRSDGNFHHSPVQFREARASRIYGTEVTARGHNTASLVWDSYNEVRHLNEDSASYANRIRSARVLPPISAPQFVKHSTDDSFFPPMPDYKPPISTRPREQAAVVPWASEYHTSSGKEPQPIPEDQDDYARSRSECVSSLTTYEERTTSRFPPTAFSANSTQSCRSGQMRETSSVPRVLPEVAQSMAMQECWEDDIDYCYDHEAEADCDFQWSRTSIEQMRRNILLSMEDAPRRLHSARLPNASLRPAPMHLPDFTNSPGLTPTLTPGPLTPSFDDSSAMRINSSRAHDPERDFAFNNSPGLLVPASPRDETAPRRGDDILFVNDTIYSSRQTIDSHARLSTQTVLTSLSGGFSHRSQASNASNTTVGSRFANPSAFSSRENVLSMHNPVKTLKPSPSLSDLVSRHLRMSVDDYEDQTLHHAARPVLKLRTSISSTSLYSSRNNSPLSPVDEMLSASAYSFHNVVNNVAPLPLPLPPPNLIQSPTSRPTLRHSRSAMILAPSPPRSSPTIATTARNGATASARTTTAPRLLSRASSSMLDRMAQPDYGSGHATSIWTLKERRAAADAACDGYNAYHARKASAPLFQKAHGDKAACSEYEPGRAVSPIVRVPVGSKVRKDKQGSAAVVMYGLFPQV